MNGLVLSLSPTTKSQIALLVTMLVFALRGIFKIDLPPAFQGDLVEFIFYGVSLAIYLLRGGLKAQHVATMNKLNDITAIAEAGKLARR